MGSITPISGGSFENFTGKSFWKRPEGTTAKWVLGFFAAGAALAGLVFIGPVIAIATQVMQNLIALTVEGIIEAVLIAFCVALGFNKTLHTVIKNVFQSAMRTIARTYTEVDPIGILRNTLDNMKSERAKLDSTIQRFAGTDEKLQRNIRAKQDEILQLQAQATKAEQMAVGKPEFDRNTLLLKRGNYLEKAGMLMTGVKQLQTLESEANKMLSAFRQWAQIADSKIQRTTDRVEFYSEQRTMILDAQATLSIGQRLLKGDPEQLKLMDMALDYLDEDTSRTLGEMREFSRFTESISIDDAIARGAAADMASKQLADFSQKLLTAGQEESSAADRLPANLGQPQPISVGRGTGAGSDYGDMFNRK
jgi:phage shock protein A